MYLFFCLVLKFNQFVSILARSVASIYKFRFIALEDCFLGSFQVIAQRRGIHIPAIVRPDSNPGPLDKESCALPLDHAPPPLLINNKMHCWKLLCQPDILVLVSCLTPHAKGTYLHWKPIFVSVWITVTGKQIAI